MSDRIHLSVVTAGGTVFERNVSYVNLPTAFGSLGVLGGHAPMVCNVERGTLRCSFDGGSARVLVGSGVASIKDDEMLVLVSDAETEN